MATVAERELPEPEPDDLLAVGEVARRTGVAVSALHYYETLGLISSTRTPTNQRRYRRHMIRRISLIVIAKRLGIPLATVAGLLAPLPMDRMPTRAEWQRISKAWKRTLQERRRILEALEHELTGCIGCGCLSMKACRLLNPDDELSREGPGARRVE
ncbi:redox-sensitive transcriptional activator SoxR [Antrihabitans sp. YC3-6]|uniref:Redox-sensitive transcriptional activator SoxR n=1 Tax=Antrihabitans stalagmiti TaxID=2799499 RepID=A0A934NUH4_9NOCA|nr:redox-sensitive transcriptional activator SoxR [Antrihabitans stalagmiti]MBJ8341833.1 redox-sensitive transcriptional activator SoxR [Antrihabitans stalagmiti]